MEQDDDQRPAGIGAGNGPASGGAESVAPAEPLGKAESGARKRASNPRPAHGAASARAGSRHQRAIAAPRGGPARPVADLVPQIGRAAFRRFGFVQSSVVTRWPEIVGKAHARVCAPESIRFERGEKSQGRLNLVVLPAHAPLIQHVIPEIIERVNRFFGYQAVARVSMRQGQVQPPHALGKQGQHDQPRAIATGPIAAELGESLREIGDPELRMVLTSLAQTLSRQPPAQSAHARAARPAARPGPNQEEPER